MLCPKCNQEIKQVNVISECWQKADVNDDGQIDEYGSIEDMLDTVKIEHRDGGCLADLTELITE